MACTDVAKVKAKAMVINLIICSSNVNLQDFRAAITALAAGREYELIPHNQSGPDDAAAFGIRRLENSEAAAPDQQRTLDRRRLFYSSGLPFKIRSPFVIRESRCGHQIALLTQPLRSRPVD